MTDTEERVGLRAVRKPDLANARRVADILDSAVRIPGTGIRFGLDSVLGLIPGAGDVAGAAFASYLILQAARMGVPRDVIMRMVANVAVDTIGGGVPVLGDIFDVVWKANRKNLDLLERSVASPSAPPRGIGKGTVIAALVILALIAIGAIVLAVAAVKAIAGLIA